ncbi:DUF3970 family protein [Halalkalibacter nanhaiisediminis]|uniref:Uncharacterized protein DUF3970 n=1 Tax=Halalkalibacter nanhaiisediminis TaxID=688079 RepID=A0A562QSQ1_9BACI|nr:DUF3970 family protein [Halalkalibacter nanhaiisediminis]TWI59210.1 uncharacterized protein DUF3970 [Halalkalibacter nanhaiisediminis]
MRVRINPRDEQELALIRKRGETITFLRITNVSDIRDSTRSNNPKYKNSKELTRYLDVKK